jgi:hypothetical protein
VGKDKKGKTTYEMCDKKGRVLFPNKLTKKDVDKGLKEYKEYIEAGEVSYLSDSFLGNGMIHMLGQKDSERVTLEFSKFRRAKIYNTFLKKRYEYMTFLEETEQTIVEKDKE